MMANQNAGRYVVRQPIKDLHGKVLGYEIRYDGEDSAYDNGEKGNQDHAVAGAVYNFLTQNTDRAFRGATHFMNFTVNLLMKQTPKLFNPSDLVIQVDDNVIIHPLAMRFVERYSKEGYKVAVNEFQFSPRYISILDRFDYIMINFRSTKDSSIRAIVEPQGSTTKPSTRRRSSWRWTRWRAAMWRSRCSPPSTPAATSRATSSA